MTSPRPSTAPAPPASPAPTRRSRSSCCRCSPTSMALVDTGAGPPETVSVALVDAAVGDIRAGPRRRGDREARARSLRWSPPGQSTVQRRAIRVSGLVQGVGFRPFVHALASRLGLVGFVGNDERGVFIEAEGAGAELDRAAGRAPAIGHRRWRWSPAWVRRRLPPAAATGFAIAASSAGGPAGHAGLRPTPRPARTACASCATRPTAATGTRSSPARTAARGSPSSPACPTTAPPPRWPASRCAPPAPGVPRPGRPALPRPADLLPRLRAAAAVRPARAGPSRAAGAAVRRTRSPRPPRRCGPARCSRSRASAATTWPRWPRDEHAVAALRARKHREDKPFAVLVPGPGRRRGRCAHVDAGRGGRADLAPRRPIVLLRRRAGRRGRRGGRARQPPPRPAAALHPGCTTCCSTRVGRADRADQRKRLRRADRAPRRRRRPTGWPGSPTRSSPTTGRSAPAPTTRCCGWWRGRPYPIRRSRGFAPGADRGCRGRPRRPVLGCGAELKNTFCLLRGRRGVRVAPHRRPGERRDAARLHRRRSRTCAGCSTSSPRCWRTTCTRSTCPPSGRWSQPDVRAGRRAAPPRAPGRLPGRARRGRPGDRDRLRRARLRHRRRAVGRRGVGRVADRVHPARAPGAGAAARWRHGDPAAVADRGGLAARPPGSSCPTLAARIGPEWTAVQRLLALRLAAAARPPAPAGCSTRSPRCRRPGPGELRGPGGDRAGTAGRTGATGRLPGPARRRP